MRGFGSTRGALAALAFACAASVWLHLTGEHAISGSSAVLGSPAYDMQSVVAPAASGPLLTALTYLLTATPLGPPIRRFLLNDNKVEILRELAAQSNNTPPLYYPMRRVGAAVHEAHAAAASSPDGSLSVALRDGFAPHATFEVVLASDCVYDDFGVPALPVDDAARAGAESPKPPPWEDAIGCGFDGPLRFKST